MSEITLNEKVDTFFAAADGDPAALKKLYIAADCPPVKSADQALVNRCLTRADVLLDDGEFQAFAAKVAADERIQKHLPAIALDTVRHHGLPHTRLDRGIDKEDDGVSRAELTDAMTRTDLLQWPNMKTPIDISMNAVQKQSLKYLQDNFDSYRALDKQDHVISTNFFGRETRGNHANISVSDLGEAHKRLMRSYTNGVPFSLK